MRKSAILVSLILVFGLGFDLRAQEDSSLVIREIIGAVEVDRGDKTWVEARTGMRLSPGARVRTGQGGLVKASLGNDLASYITLREGVLNISEVLLAANERKARFSLLSGRIAAVVSGGYLNDFRIRTQTATAGVRGTEFGVEYGDADHETKVLVFNGRVEVQSLDDLGEPRGLPREVRAGEKVAVRPSGEVLPANQVTPVDEGRYGLKLRGEPLSQRDQDLAQTPAETNQDQGAASERPREVVTPASSISRDGTPAPKSGSGWGGSLGPVVIGEKTWTRMIFSPQLQLGKLILAFYIPIYYDANEPIWEISRWYNADEYDFTSFGDFVHDLLLKFRFIQFGEKGEEVFIRVGNIEDFVIGHGFIMNNYNNMLQFPSARRIGIQLDLDFGFFGFESMMADAWETKLFGGRLYFRPFGGFLDRLAFGISYITDIRTSPDLNNYATVFGTGIDFEFPLPDLGILTWMIFADYAALGYKTVGTVGGETDASFGFNGGHGFTYGLKGRILFFKYQLAFRNLSGKFIPEYFDSYYDVERQARAEALIGGERSDFNGWLFETGFDLDEIGYLMLNFQEYYGTVGGVASTDNKLTLGAELKKGVIPYVRALFLYERTHVIGKELFKDIFGDNTVTTFSLFCEISEGVELVGTYRRFYEKGGDYTGSYSIETQFGL